jgi:AraC-like DNA-binding protein
MRQTAIGLAVLYIVMPPPDGFRLLEKMRGDPRLAGVPVLLLTDKVVTMEDISRIEFHPRLALRNKGILSPGEAEEDIRRLAEGREWLPAPTGAVAKRSIAYLNRNYPRALTRWKLAEAVGVSEDYLTRVFRAETGMTPWDYLARLRIAKAGELLLSGAESVGSIAARVGIADQAYFTRVFRKVTGMTPQAFRSSGPKGSPGRGSGSPEGAPR